MREGTAPVSASDKEAQTTAIVTGFVSLVLGVRSPATPPPSPLTPPLQFGYLALSQAMGNREMMPPPPEALGL